MGHTHATKVFIFNTFTIQLVDVLFQNTNGFYFLLLENSNVFFATATRESVV